MSLLQPILITGDADLDDSTYMNYNYFIVNADGGGFTITLRNIVADGMNFTIIRSDATGNTIKINPFGGQTVNNGGSIDYPINTITQYVSNGTDWVAPYVTFSF